MVKEANPDVVFIPGFNPEVPLIAKTGDRLGLETTYIGADGWDATRISWWMLMLLLL